MTALLLGLGGWLLLSVVVAVAWGRWQRAVKRRELVGRVADAVLAQGKARAQVMWVIYERTGRSVTVRDPERFIENGSWSN